jgi:alpha-tubulin suppressor-like RCC1 family protein
MLTPHPWELLFVAAVAASCTKASPSIGTSADGGSQNDRTPVSASSAPTTVPAPELANPSVRVVEIAAHGSRTCAISEDAAVRCWGQNERGEFGLGNRCNARHPTPTIIPDLSDIRSIALGDFHACAVRKDGSALCWGWNDDGQLGLRTTETCCNGPSTVSCATVPKPVPNLTGVTQIAVGGSTTCVLLNDGTVRCWGAGDRGELGFKPASRCKSGLCARTPTGAPGLTGVKQVALGTSFTCVLESDGSVWCAGANYFGQLGLGTTESRSFTFRRVASLDNVEQIDLGGDHACALVAGGSLRCWGSNEYGQLGFSASDDCSGHECATTPAEVPDLSAVRQVALGDRSTCALLTDGSVRCWGKNDGGALGFTSSQTCSAGSLAFDCARAAVAVPGLPPLTRVATAGSYACGLSAGGPAWCWGDGHHGELGFRATQCDYGSIRACGEPPARVEW